MKVAALISIIVLISVLMCCVKPFEPAPLKKDNSYLVVDGFLNAGAPTTIRLTRTRNLSDTNSAVPEQNADLTIEGESGESYSFVPAANGEYTSGNNGLNPAVRYRLRINTANGKTYLSDFLEVKNTPEIDSVEWSQDKDIFIFVNTHDPANKTLYYRWDFIETSEYHAAYDSYLDFKNGQIVFLEPDQYRTICYKTFYSTDILIGSSAALSQDIISHMQLNRIPNDNSKISVRYSILIRQYALTAEAYQYWQILKQNSEETGGLFGPQPSQLNGNIHCTTDPQEPVIGFLSACSLSEKRIFIKHGQLKDRLDNTYSVLCKETFVYNTDSFAYYLNDGSRLPAYFITDGPLAVVPNFCVDCRLNGGITAKPSFW